MTSSTGPPEAPIQFPGPRIQVDVLASTRKHGEQSSAELCGAARRPRKANLWPTNPSTISQTCRTE
jgi:hypothetical protein